MEEIKDDYRVKSDAGRGKREMGVCLAVAGRAARAGGSREAKARGARLQAAVTEGVWPGDSARCTKSYKRWMKRWEQNPCGATGVMQRCLILVVLNRGVNRSHLCFRKIHRRQAERGGNRLGWGELGLRHLLSFIGGNLGC